MRNLFFILKNVNLGLIIGSKICIKSCWKLLEKIRLTSQDPNFYLYSAASPKTGKEFTLLLPNVNIQCMNIFLEEFVKANKERKIVIVMDGAGWHQSKKLIIPDYIRIIILPPYSPELNPTEKLWQYIKDHTIKNRIYKTLQELEMVVCKFVKLLTPEIIRSVCNVNYVLL